MKKRTLKLKATLPFNYGVAKKLMNINSYKTYSKNRKEYKKIENEKRRRDIKIWDIVDRILDRHKTLVRT